MVQRKVPNKHGIHADRVNAEEKLLGNLKPTSCQQQDGKNRGPDLKKKMKRSKSIKLSDIESSKSSPLKKTIAPPGKSPPSRLPTATATLQKQHMIKATDGSPNYMKSTSSSEARKERSQVSSMTTRTGLDAKNLRRRNSNSSEAGSISSNRSTRALTRTSSLKLVRTLTKAPTFKPITRKSPRVALCSEVNVQKATCSSTLKGSKFPSYLMLNPGGTEADGTSVIKVCPYNYCSLNGHDHTPLPPLKYFLRARRHSLKTQRSMKLEVSSPRKGTNMSDAGMEKIDAGIPLDSFGLDFFVEIYANDKVDEAEATQRGTEEVDTGATEKENKKQLCGNLYDASPHLKIDSEEYFEQYPDTVVVNTKIKDFLLQEQETENADPDYSPSLLQDEAASGCFDRRTDIGMECPTSTEEDYSISEASGTEWKEGQFFAACEVDAEVGQFDTSDENFDAKIEYLSDFKKLDLVCGPEIIEAGEFVRNCPDEIPIDEVLLELFEEETASFASQCNKNVSELDAKQQKGKILESSHMTGHLTGDLLSSAVAAFEELSDMEEKNKGAEADLIDTWTSSSQFEDGENNLTTDMTTDNLIHCQEGRSLQGDVVTTWIQNQAAEDYNKGQKSRDTKTMAGSNPTLDQEDRIEDCEQGENVQTLTEIQLLGSSLGFPDINQDEAEINDNENCIIAEACHLNGAADDIALNKDLHDGSGPTEPQNHKFDDQFMNTNVVEELNLLEEDQDAANSFNIPAPMDSEEKTDSRMYEVKKGEEDGPGNNAGDVKKMEEEGNESDPAEKFLAGDNGNSRISQCTSLHTGSSLDQEIPNTCNTGKLKFSFKKSINDSDEERAFNPREPNFLDVVPDLEAEKVDLRHQILDDRKNAEEWMLDFALQRAVNKLAPAKERKVALLVEAFETVLPIPKYESHIRHTSAAFSHVRPIQAYS